VGTDFAIRLREARLAHGESLRGLAKRAGISPALLSQVETGKAQPSVATLFTLVNLLGISMDTVMAADPARVEALPVNDAVPVQRAADNPVFKMQNGVTWERLAVDHAGVVDSYLVTYQPGAASSVDQRPMWHPGSEFVYLLDGELTLRFDTETFDLRAGDSVNFESTRPHYYSNDSPFVARGVWWELGRNLRTPA
jgi:transcriptional regulator with XRE-family HTH domain